MTIADGVQIKLVLPGRVSCKLLALALQVLLVVCTAIYEVRYKAVHQ
jgi:hypothetical protein